MSILFETVKIKGMELRNRFVRSATYDGCADRNGNVTDRQVRLFEKLAQGGVGLVVTGIAYVHPYGQISPTQNSIADDACIPGFKRIVDAVHNRGAKIAVQLFHAGRERARVYKAKSKQAVAPTFMENDPNVK
ncbi:MAG: NADH:flavin oxidoreductase, partial [Deltaproteobacteria bacterium]|nr:NADH:flavin oxidoreductase [Deltaproteobacteria bacterium]